MRLFCTIAALDTPPMRVRIKGTYFAVSLNLPTESQMEENLTLTLIGVTHGLTLTITLTLTLIVVTHGGEQYTT